MSEIVLISTPLQEVKKIIHLADIHIRLYKRHTEYREVFERLYQSLRKRDLSDTAIVIAGDIVHSKTDMSPEMVKVVSDFLRTLSDIAPTIIIAGNHDLSISNPNRLDALTPIVENLKHPNLHYFRESGIYQFADVQFGVHSIIGLQEEWPSLSDMSGTKIGLYHGPVHNAKTDSGYTVTNKITLEKFAGFDMVMLGDIHSTQLLQESDSEIPEVLYAGSLIQQNFGEKMTGHGFAVWDVQARKVEEFVEIKNPFGYFTLILNGTDVPTISNMPDNVRLRIIADKSVELSLIKKVQATLRKKYNILECSVNYSSTKLLQQSTSTTHSLDNIQDVNHQNSLLRRYIEEKLPNTDTSTIDRILEINTKLNSQIAEDELPKNIHWKPIHLKFDNLFSYGEGNEIHFEKMNGLYGLFAANAQGKTSAFQSLCFALYDKTPSAFKGSHIINSRKESFYCELKFQAGDNVFVIERRGSRKKTGEVKVDVNFYRVESNGSTTSLNGLDRRDTNANIRSYVGTYEDFILTTLSVQNQNSLFIETGQSDRKDLLSQFIGLTVFDRLFNIASEEIKEVVGALKVFQRNDFTQKLADVQTELDVVQKLYNEASASLVNCQSNIQKTVNTITELHRNLTPNIDIIDPIPWQNKSNEMSRGLLDQEDLLSSEKVEVAQTLAERDKLKIQYNALKPEIELRQNVDKVRQSKELLLKLKGKYNVLLTESKAESDKLDRINNHKFDPSCKFCRENNHQLIDDSEKSQNKIDSIETELTTLSFRIHDGEVFLEEQKNVEVEWNKSESISRKLLELDGKIARHYLDIERIKNQIQFFRNEQQACIAVLDQYEHNKRLIEENKIIQTEINRLSVEKEKLESTIRTLQNTNQNQFSKIEVLKRQKHEMMESLRNAEDLETTLDAYETYLVVIGRDGLPYELITQIIPSLQTEVNNVLSQMVEFTVALDVDGKNINGKIVYDDERYWPLELASGMEKFIAGLAIRVALMSVSNLPKSNFLIIDEGFGVLDSDNLSSVFTLFNVLKARFEFIVLISHLDAVRDITDHTIEINRVDGFSNIKVL
jgi:DNA repair exonuclease SbcCD ATPase subunit/DNA repair exonuclease SbcCD nuclease subunit